MAGMRFKEIYSRRRRPVVSFEVFPPKPGFSMEKFRAVLDRLVGLKPDFMTVTYGAFGSTQVRTIEIAGLIRREYDIPVASHLTCVGSTSGVIQEILDEIHRSGIENIVALRGDPPQGEREFVPPEGGYRHASELVEHIAGLGKFGIAVACYPEKHIEAPDMETDLRHFHRKVEKGADAAITQLFFENSHYVSLVERARALGVRVPIVPGILPILSLKQVKRITSMCGSTIPRDLVKLLEKAGDDPGAALEVGVRQAVNQAEELLRRGAPGIHFYVLNKSSHMVRIMERLAPLLEELESSEPRASAKSV